MKTILRLSFLLSLFYSSHTSAQQYYLGINGGLEVPGLRSLYKPDDCGSIEIQAGRTIKNSKWQFETGFRKIFISSFYYPYVDFLASVPIAVRYNLPFAFLRAGYASLLWQKEEPLEDPNNPGYYYLKPSDKLYYSPALTAGFGLEKDINTNWKINMMVNTIYSLDSWNEYHGYRSAHFSDFGFLLGLDYYFIKSTKE